MALDVATGTFNTGTGAPASTVSVTGLPFQPKVVLFAWSGRTAVGQAEGSHKFGSGYMISGSDRGGATSQATHSSGSGAPDCQVFDDSCIKLLTTAGAVDGAADFSSLNSDGFTIVIDDAFVASYLVSYLAIGGTDLTDVASVTITEPGATGNQDITTLGFALNTGIDDKCVIFFGASGESSGAINATVVDSGFTLGVVAGDTPVNALMSGVSLDGAGTITTDSYCRTGECMAHIDLSAPVSRASITAWLANGFTLNWAEVSPDVPLLRALVLKGGRYQVGDALTSTDLTNQTEGTSYVPKALLVGSHNKAASTVNVAQGGDERSLGFATGASNRNYVSIHDVDNVATSDIGVAHNTDAMYANQNTGAAIAIEGLMDLVSFDGTPGFTYVMDDADPVASYFFYLLMADVPGAAPDEEYGRALLGVGA